MKKYIIFLLSFFLSFSFVNCGGGGGGGGDDDGPVINKNSLAVSNSSLTFDAAAGQQTVNVTANCDWKVSCSASWLTINPMSGNANATLTLSAQENTTTTQREAIITVTGGGFTRTISVSQRGDDIRLSISPQTMEFDCNEEEKTLAITSNSSWTTSSDQSWCTVSKSSGNGNDNITVKVSKTDAADKRTANVKITAGTLSQTVTVTQNGVTLSVSPQKVDFGNKAEEITVAITSNSSWTVSSDQSWCTVNKSSGNGNDNITVKVTQNNSAENRTTNVKITAGTLSQTVTVTQNGVSLSVSPQKVDFDYKAEEKTVAITSNSSWTVSSDQSWCTINKSSGNGNDNITVKVTQNNSADKRTANVKILCGNKTETLVVTQNGGPLPVVSKLSYSGVTFSEASCTFEVSSEEAITECGICYSTTNKNPTINDSKVASSSPANQATKSVKLTGLSKKTTYYIRAYATSVIGTSYTSEMRTFTTNNIPGEDDNGKPKYVKKQGR